LNQINKVQHSKDDGKQGAHIIARDIFPGKIHALSACHDGLHFAGSVTNLNPKSRIKIKESVRLWSQTGKLLHATAIAGHRKRICDVEFLPPFVARILDEDPNTKIGFLGSAGHDETFRLWMWDQVSGLPRGKYSVPDVQSQQQFISESEKARKLLTTSKSNFTDFHLPFLELSPQITPIRAKTIITKSAEISKLRIEDYSEFFQCSVGDFVKARYKNGTKFYRCIVLRRQHQKAILKYLELGKIASVNLSSIKSTLFVEKSTNIKPMNENLSETNNDKISEDMQPFLEEKYHQSYSTAEGSALKTFNDFVGEKVNDEETINGVHNKPKAIRRKKEKSVTLESQRNIRNQTTMYGSCTGNRKNSQSDGCFVS